MSSSFPRPITVRSVWRASAAALALSLAASVAHAQVPDSVLDEPPPGPTVAPIPDRIEGFNRAIFRFNDVTYRYVLHPVGRGYAAVVPAMVRRGIGNVFHNLAFPTRFVGNVLEGDVKGAAKETGRFLVNSTVGIAGLLPAADDIPQLQTPESDLGVAWGTWGIGHGTYLVLPFRGPSSVRDGIGSVISGLYLAPTQYLEEWEHRAIATGVDTVNGLPEAMDNYAAMKDSAVDPYIALRDFFASRRAQQIKAQKDARTASGKTSPTPTATAP